MVVSLLIISIMWLSHTAPKRTLRVGVTAMVAGFLCGYKLKAVNPELAENEIAIAAASKAAEASGSPAPARAAAGRVGAEGKSNGGNGSSTVRTSVLKASAKKADLVKGIYEGGMKVWECTHDLVNYMIAADVKIKPIPLSLPILPPHLQHVRTMTWSTAANQLWSST